MRINFLWYTNIRNQLKVIKLLDHVCLILPLGFLANVTLVLTYNILPTWGRNRDSVADQYGRWATLSRPWLHALRKQATFSRHKNSLLMSSRQENVYGVQTCTLFYSPLRMSESLENIQIH